MNIEPSSSPTTKGSRRRFASALPRSRTTRWALGVLIFVHAVALLAPVLPLKSPSQTDIRSSLTPPTLKGFFEKEDARDANRPDAETGGVLMTVRRALFGTATLGPILGTDSLGRCVLSRLIYGARLSLAVGLLASAVSLLVGVLYGGFAGYFRGRIDQVMMRFVDVLYSLPLMFMVMFIVAMLRGVKEARPEFHLSQIFVLFLVIGAISWLTLARMVRTEVISLRETEFVLASVAAGATPSRVLLRHMLPNVMPVVLVTLTLTVPRVMLFEAYLSFLGLGVEAPDVSWGLLARQGFDAMTAVHSSPWLILVPGIAFAVTLLSMNLLGDGLRDALDPRLKQRGSP